MKVNFYTEDVGLPKIDEIRADHWLTQVIHYFDFEIGEISIIFTSDNYLLTLNNDYLKHDYFTDIITFNYSSKKCISGDLFISVERVTENANNFSVPFLYELHRVMVHGVLHLIGFDDHSEQEIQKMRFEEEKWLKLIFA